MKKWRGIKVGDAFNFLGTTEYVINFDLSSKSYPVYFSRRMMYSPEEWDQTNYNMVRNNKLGFNIGRLGLLLLRYE